MPYLEALQCVAYRDNTGEMPFLRVHAFLAGGLKLKRQEIEKGIACGLVRAGLSTAVVTAAPREPVRNRDAVAATISLMICAFHGVVCPSLVSVQASVTGLRVDGRDANVTMLQKCFYF